MPHSNIPPHWAYQLAEALARRADGRLVTLESGYGPSGLPHMGTVAEVLRTAMVARAYRELTDGAPLRLLAFTDDMDGLRRVPGNVPGGEAMAQHIGAPLCEVPSPYGPGSFAAHNAATLRHHLRHFGLLPVDPSAALPRLLAGEPTAPDEVLCVMASDLYRGGHLDPVLRQVAAAAPELVRIVAPELRGERRSTWCPFVPLHRGRMVTDTRDWCLDGEVLEWTDAAGDRHRTPILGGSAKLQWRVDWAARWVALGVDLELHGKDLADSVRLGSRIARAIGGRPPQTFQYELFLDEDGAKQSKSVGNGVAVADWERHAPPAAFWHFLARDPRRARRIGRATIPQVADEWLTDLRATSEATVPLGLIHPDGPPEVRSRLGFSTILGTAALADADSPDAVWRLLEGYDPVGIDRDDPLLRALVACAVARHLDIGRPGRTYVVPDEAGRAALTDLASALRGLPQEADAEAVQFEAYETGKRHGGREGLRSFFRLVYGVLLGEDSGPRLSTLAEAVGRPYLVGRLDAMLAK